MSAHNGEKEKNLRAKIEMKNVKWQATLLSLL
jgi:hypothetical protein